MTLTSSLSRKDTLTTRQSKRHNMPVPVSDWVLCANQEVVMKNYGDITRIGCLVLTLAWMAVLVPPAFGRDVGEGIRDPGFPQDTIYARVKVSRTSGLHHGFQPQVSGRSIHVISGGSLKRASHDQNVMDRRRSRSVLPLILYPWNWAYMRGMTEDVLEEYLEEIYDRQDLAMEEGPAPPPIPASPPLIIEEQCGKYVRIPWPEPGVLFEPREELSCPSGE